jgi:hypothetical protein
MPKSGLLRATAYYGPGETRPVTSLRDRYVLPTIAVFCRLPIHLLLIELPYIQMLVAIVGTRSSGKTAVENYLVSKDFQRVRIVSDSEVHVQCQPVRS